MIPRGVVFDAYGTLLDVHSAMQRHAGRLGAGWESISAAWRSKQLEYSWIRSLTGPAHHRDFAALTQEALEFVAERHGITDRALLAEISTAYRTLDSYPEVPEMLRAVRANGIATAILSNGSPDMLASAVQAAGIDTLLDEVLSVEEVGIFKPDPSVYDLAIRRLGGAADRLVFVSSNAWDGFAAGAAGFRVVWVNRTGQPDEYGLRAHATERADLSDLVSAVA
jgi:2-haloacid dehalogenase